MLSFLHQASIFFPDITLFFNLSMDEFIGLVLILNFEFVSFHFRRQWKLFLCFDNSLKFFLAFFLVFWDAIIGQTSCNVLGLYYFIGFLKNNAFLLFYFIPDVV